ncbi:hypothetical protein [Prochlorococcus marinus]|uniref:GHMP family kinase ATP-binding protein n=1 Tax=Prochlorococcus marinus TaxID=1219 RepID=UPI001ADC9F47|nr:hypothetical protein [Prochlorococcus marinus]MBO8221397.1 hypothetical protein [Prochlorococcus marinus CUG1417]MBW3074207.1 hypothetical protein [Prochlorococcus marinus str. MU1417]
MIYIGKSPYRVSLLGGSSDLDWFVKDEGFGVCLGYSLDKYSYSVLNVLPSISKKGILEYSNREEYTNSNEIVHPIVREVLSYFDIPNYIELKTFGFATGGSGLGGSASFILALISSLSKAFKFELSKNEIIEKACYLEIHKLGKPIGKQDQYLCASEGFNSFTFYSDNNVKRNILSKQKTDVLNRLSDNFYLIPTNKKRSADSVLAKIKNDIEAAEKILQIRDIAVKFIEFEDQRDYKIEEFFNDSVRDSWLIKKSICNTMNSTLKEQYDLIDKIIPNNWIRLIGAGNGGYFLVSSKIGQDKIYELSFKEGLKGVFKAKPATEGLSNFQI